MLAFDIRTKLHTGAAYQFTISPQYVGGDKLPAVVLVHGWGSKIFSNRTYTEAAERLRALGYHTLLLSLRGHEDSDGDLDTVSREDHAEDIEAAFAYLAERPEVDTKRLCVFGASYGAYMLAAMPIRGARLALLRAPALYPDEGWEQPKVVKNANLSEWRKVQHTQAESLALRGIAQYKGALSIVWSEHDEQMPTSVLGSYIEAIGSDDPVEILYGAKHTLTDEERLKFLVILERFFRDNYPKSV